MAKDYKGAFELLLIGGLLTSIRSVETWILVNLIDV